MNRNRGSRPEKEGRGPLGAFRERVAAYEEALDLKTRAERRWFRAALALLVIYMEFVAYAQHTAYGGNAPVMDAVTALAIVPLCLAGVRFFHKIRFASVRVEERGRDRRRQLVFCAAVFAVTFLYFFAWQRAYWPGSFSPDSIGQYGQSVTGAYNDWHPVLQTWIFFTLPSRLHAGPAMIILMQLIWFSMAETYMLFVLYRRGASGLFLLLSWAYIAANPNTACIMLYPWKDSALSIFSMVVFGQVVQIYATRGAWLRKWYNLAAFAAFCFLAMNVRHNAVLLVIPLLVIMLLFCKRARAQLLVALGAVVVATVVLKGPVFSAVGVEAPGGRTLETAGLPMTVLANIYVNDRDSLPSDVRSFLDAYRTEEEWGRYVTGSFNSIKFGLDNSMIEEKGLATIVGYMARSWQRSPQFAWKAFVELTKMVWSVDGGGGWGIGPGIVDNTYGIRYHDQNQFLLREFSAYAPRARQYATKYLFQYTGIIIGILLFMAVSHIGNGNLARVFIALSLMAYDFGTMLLLSGADFRFFHLNFLVVIPLMFLMGTGDGTGDGGSALRDGKAA